MNDHMRHIERADGSPGYLYTLPGVGVAQTLGYVTVWGPHDDATGSYPRAVDFPMGEPMAARPIRLEDDGCGWGALCEHVRPAVRFTEGRKRARHATV